MSFGDNGEDEGVLAVRELVGAVRVLPDVVLLHNKFGLYRDKPGLVLDHFTVLIQIKTLVPNNYSQYFP